MYKCKYSMKIINAAFVLKLLLLKMTLFKNARHYVHTCIDTCIYVYNLSFLKNKTWPSTLHKQDTDFFPETLNIGKMYKVNN